ncbi:MAG: hypothetical protein J0L77_01780 [Alphaproteobacteria bacterium]|nr:hypothetical protein [Alphaproteobacteria bacterium]
MSKLISSGEFYWPPRGWKHLGVLASPKGQAMAKDIETARIYGLNYRIHRDAVFESRQSLSHYHISLDAWEYSILNESREYPVLSFDILDRVDLLKPAEACLTDIKILARPLDQPHQHAHRVLNAAMIMIRQIDRGIVPDVDRILAIHRLVNHAGKKMKTRQIDMPHIVTTHKTLTKSWQDI